MKLEKFIYFVANLSKTLRINFYQNRSSIVEVMIKKIGCVFYASQCKSDTRYYQLHYLLQITYLNYNFEAKQ